MADPILDNQVPASAAAPVPASKPAAPTDPAADPKPAPPLSQAEKNVFGHDAVRGPDGNPVERGIGSPDVDPVEAAHHAANMVKICAADVESISAALTVATAKLIDASKEAIAAAHVAFPAPVKAA